MDPSYAALIVSAVSAIASAVSLLVRGDPIETKRQRRLCKHLTQLRRHLISVVEIGEEIGLSLDTDSFDDEEDIVFLRRLFQEQNGNIGRAYNSFWSVRSVLEFESEALSRLGNLLSEKDEVIRLLHVAATVSQDELRNRLMRIADDNEFAVVDLRDGPSVNLRSWGTALPDDNFDKIRKCVPELTESIKQVCKPVHIWT